jgi:hypothetical protein
VARPTFVVLIEEGLQVPLTPSFDVAGSAGAVAFRQNESAIAGNVGEILLSIVMFKETGVEQLLADDGVNLKIVVPGLDVLTLAGLHVPAIPSLDVNGNIGAVVFWQSGPISSNVGETGALTFNTIIFDVSEPAHGPLVDTTQLTASLLTKLLLMYNGLFVPTFLLFNSHW